MLLLLLRVGTRVPSVLLSVVLQVLTKLSDRLREMGILEVCIRLVAEAMAPVSVFALQLEAAELVGFLCE